MTNNIFIKAEEKYKRLCVDTMAKSMGYVFDILHQPSFAKVHRSFVVNMESVDSFDGWLVYIGKEPIHESFDAIHKE